MSRPSRIHWPSRTTFQIFGPLIHKYIYDKASEHNEKLTKEERALLRSRGDLFGKALADPDSLAEAEVYEIMRCPPRMLFVPTSNAPQPACSVPLSSSLQEPSAHGTRLFYTVPGHGEAQVLMEHRHGVNSMVLSVIVEYKWALHYEIYDFRLLAQTYPGLKSFFYAATPPLSYYWECVEGYSGDDHFQPTTDIQHLLPHAPTLTSLHLDLRYRGETYASVYSPGLDTGSFDIECLSSTQPSFFLFPALKHLFLNAAAVCNTPRRASSVNDDKDNALLTRLLPPNIESLCLAAWVWQSVKPRMAKALVYLARTVRTGREFTRVKSVSCDVEMAKGWVLEGYGVAQAFKFAF
ncbi:hypothetical protein VTI74DRAFT_7936 [Chaetomium olivicolor]